jgi:Ca2+-binding RTX toxin-like protein
MASPVSTTRRRQRRAAALATAAFIAMPVGIADATDFDYSIQVSVTETGLLRVVSFSTSSDRIDIDQHAGVPDITVSANGETSAVPPCVSTGPATVRCPTEGVQSIQVFADNGDDIVAVTADLPGAVFAGPDSDRVDIESSAAWVIDLNSGDDFASPGLGHDLVSGGPGQDTVLYDRRSTGIAVSLDGVANDGAPGEQDNILTDVEVLDGGAGDDLLVGGDGNDFLDGNGGNDDLRGGAGDDAISGHGGDDTIDGGTGADNMHGHDGVDTVTYASRTEPVSVTLLLPCGSTPERGCLDGQTNDGQTSGQVGEDDTVIAVENATGGSGNDTLLGSSAANVVRGGGGNDSIDGGSGADVLDGGAGIDSATYQTRTGDLTVRLDNLANDGQAGEADNVINTETVLGGTGNDLLVGSKFRDMLSGGPGNDTLLGLDQDDGLQGGPGTDITDGGYGNDTITYADHTAPVTVSLDDIANDGQAGEDDNARDIQNIIGGTGNDVLIGNALNNVLRGLAGDDRLFGLDGNDTLIGSEGTDFADGGNGTDTCQIETSTRCP